jgi:hypothetical protein
VFENVAKDSSFSMLNHGEQIADIAKKTKRRTSSWFLIILRTYSLSAKPVIDTCQIEVLYRGECVLKEMRLECNAV